MQVRDFCLDLQDNSGNVISERKYLDDQLQMKPGMCISSLASLFFSLYQHASGQSPKVKQYNNIRSCITSYFRDRDCVTLPPPLSHEVSLF